MTSHLSDYLSHGKDSRDNNGESLSTKQGHSGQFQ